MKTPKPENQTLTLEPVAPEPQLPAARQPTSLDILNAAIRGGVSSENVAVVKEIVAMRREEQAEQAKVAFVKAFFQLRKNLPVIFADKEVRTKSGALAFEYCSPQEIKDTLEPLMAQHGFSTMTGQEMGDGRVTVTITLMHEAGHCESRSFTVRISPGNQLMTPTQCDAAASTTAERHALIKLFGLRTRINPNDDPRLRPGPITAEQADELLRRVKETNSNEQAFLKLAGVGTITAPSLDDYKKIQASQYEMLDEMLCKKEQRGR